MNSERYATGVRWHPPDWRWSIVDEAHQTVGPMYEPLKSLDLADTTYEALWEQCRCLEGFRDRFAGRRPLRRDLPIMVRWCH